MNSFMRSISILASATILSLVSPIIALGNTGDTNTPELTGVTTGTTTFNATHTVECTSTADCSACNVKKQVEAGLICKENIPKKKKKDDGGDGGGSGGQPQQQQPAQQQQPNNDQANNQNQGSNSGSGGECNDTPADEKGTANESNIVGGNKADISKGGTTRGQGLKKACEGMQRSFVDDAEQAYQQGSSQGMTGDKYQELKKSFDEYISNRESCLSGHATAANACLEGLSPDVAGTAAGVNNVLGQVGQNASDSCGKMSQAMDLANKGLTAFTGGCAAAKGSCDSSCSKAKSGLDSLVSKAKGANAICSDPNNKTCDIAAKKYNAAIQAGLAMAEQEKNASDEKSVAGKLKLCQKDYSQLLGSALQGIMSMLAGLKQGSKCEEETDGTAEQLGTIADKCILPENASLPECICKVNPRTVGCSTAYEKMDASAAGQVAGGLTDKANVDPSRNTASLDKPPSDLVNLPSSGDGSLPGSPGGGGPGLGGSAGGPGAGAGKPGEAAAKGLNANILGGTGSGGGSGGGWGAGGAGDKYRQYLPGGAKDPAKAMAGQEAWAKEVTGGGGKSNWEKVKDRYRDNKPSLLNNN